MVGAAVRSFSDLGLSSGLAAAVAALGIETPTPIQAEVIPAMLAGRDVIGQARTGSGKTLAFAIPIAGRCDPSLRAVQALVLAPTRELVIQIGAVLRQLAQPRQLQVALLYGGRSLEPEKQALAGGAQIVVGAPGRTLDHLRQATLSLRNLRIFVLDEADEMLDRGFGPDVERILSAAPAKRQTALLSATMPEWVGRTAARHLHDPVRAQVDAGLEAPPEIRHVVYAMDTTRRFGALRTLLDRQGPAPIIVFGRTKHGVKKLAAKLTELGYSVAALQGNMSQNARERVMADFRSGAVRTLLATNVAARGLDIDAVEQVINYELADSPELHTHRAGRTGRMGKTGETVTFVTPGDAPKWREIERALGRRLTPAPWTGDEYPAAPPAPAHQNSRTQPREATPRAGAGVPAGQRRPQMATPRRAEAAELAGQRPAASARPGNTPSAAARRRRRARSAPGARRTQGGMAPAERVHQHMPPASALKEPLPPQSERHSPPKASARALSTA